MTPGSSETQEVVRTVKLGKTRFSESRMNQPTDGPRFIFSGPMHITLGAVYLSIHMFGGTSFSHTATGLSQNRDPWIINKVGNDQKSMLF
jgi:hypothetical protein